MTVDDDTTLEKSRRALLAASAAALAFAWLQNGISTINLLGTKIETGPDHQKIWVLLLISLLWVGWRYISIMDFSLMFGSSQYSGYKEKYATSLTVKYSDHAIKELCKHHSEKNFDNIKPNIIYSWTSESSYFSFMEENLEKEDMTTLVDAYRKKLGFVATIDYVIHYKHESGRRSFRGSFSTDLEPPIVIRWLAMTGAVIGMFIFDRWSTDHLIPFPLFMVSLGCSIYHLV